MVEHALVLQSIREDTNIGLSLKIILSLVIALNLLAPGWS